MALKGLLVLFLSFVSQMTQANVSNGDFSAGGANWGTFVYGDPFVAQNATSDPSVSFSSGSAVLATGNGYDNEVVICQGASSCDVSGFPVISPFLIESNALTLEFDVAFLSLGSDVDEAGFSFFTDALNVQLWNPTDFLLDINIFVDTSGRVSLDLADFAGTGAALFLRLYDEDDGFNTQVTIDNIEVITSAVVLVPETTTLYLFWAGLFLLGTSKRRKISS